MIMTPGSLPGFTIKETIYDSPKTMVFRGIRNCDNLPVVLKVPSAEYPTQNEILRYNNEFKVLSSLHLDGVIELYSLEKYQNSFAIIEEDINGVSLAKILREGSIELIDFLKMAIQIVEGLGNLHQHGVIHKDINPANIIHNVKTKETKITDFGISTLLERETQEILAPENLEGTLAYMSPEQTGRMNRPIDYRTDLYSLGATFYEILAGQRVFSARDALELVHAHIAMVPTPIEELKQEVPSMVSQIVMILLAKNAEDRYQGTYGLKVDLEECLSRLEHSGKIDEFTLKQHDVCSKFEISHKLYGREKELKRLLEGFSRISKGRSELIVVNGYSGVGKTVLIKELHRPIVACKGYFISGKFEQFQRNVPYWAFIQAFRELIRQILSESEQRLDHWKNELNKALKNNGKVITSLIPELEIIIGKQAEVPELGPLETQNRLNFVFTEFIGVFSKSSHPLVVFLDDMQWADMPSLNLVQSLATNKDSQFLLIIGSYRSNEVGSSHPLAYMLNEVKNSRQAVESILVSPLGKEDLSRLLSDSLHCSIDEVLSLAEIIFEKTRGNPFFVNQLLQTLYNDALIKFNSMTGQWTWEASEILNVGITENVVELMADKIRKLPSKVQETLKIGACIGNEFGIALISLVTGKAHQESASHLREASLEGLVVSSGDVYRFQHDKIQQATYELIDKQSLVELHLKIGRLLYESLDGIDKSEKIFDIANHYNLGSCLIADSKELQIVAELNIYAGKKAKKCTDYLSAINYFTSAHNMLSDDIWDSNYHLAFELSTNWAESEYLAGNFSKGEDVINETLTKIKSNEEHASLIIIKLKAYGENSKYDETIAAGLDALNLLGIDFKPRPSMLDVVLEVFKVKIALGNSKPIELLDRSYLQDPQKIMIINILVYMSNSAYLSNNENLLAVLLLRLTKLSIKLGITKFSPYAYATYGLILAGELQDFKMAKQFGELAVKLVHKLPDRSLSGRTFFVVASFVEHWVRPIRETLSIYDQAYAYSLEFGDLAYCGYCLTQKSWVMLFIGEHIVDVLEESTKAAEFTKKIKDQTMIDNAKVVQHFCLALIGNTQGVTSLESEDFSEQSLENFMPLPRCNFYLSKCQLYYLHGEYDQAWEMACKAEVCKNGVMSQPSSKVHGLFYGLSAAALYCEADPNLKKKLLSALRKSIKQMKKWVEACPKNCIYMYYLLSAEESRIKDHIQAATEYYDQAIELAIENNFTQFSAIANECAGNFYLSRKQNKIALQYLIEARYLYEKWGASAKIQYFDKLYESYFRSKLPNTSSAPFDPTITSQNVAAQVTDGSQFLDIATILKATQTLASEVVLEQLLLKLMKIVRENAGADKAMLILEGTQDQKLYIEAEIYSNHEPRVMHSQLLSDNENISEKIVLFAARTKENIVLGDASKEGKFTQDPYIQRYAPKSVLCTPIINQGRLIGILYLENNIAIGAFTPKHLKVLNIIISQAAISIENAQLYESLEHKVKVRTKELNASLENLKETQEQLVESKKMASLGGLVAGIAHELNTPLGVCLTTISNLKFEVSEINDSLKQGLKKSSLNKFIESVSLSSNLLLKNIERLISLSTNFKKLAVDVSTQEKTTFNVASTFQMLVNMLEYDKNKLSLKTSIECQKDLSISSFSDEFFQFAEQIFLNSIHHGFREKESGEIVVRASEKNDQIYIELEDNGCGIPKKHHEKIFEPFYTTDYINQHSGLGLHLVYNIVTQKLNGTIECESEENQGTKFMISLPLDKS